MTSEATQAFFGARISLYPMTDSYVPVILRAVGALEDRGLEIKTDSVSTFVGGDRDAVFAAVADTFALAAREGHHVVMTMLLSHGCPGETVCEVPPGRGAIAPREAGAMPGGGVTVDCQWSLYPLGVPGYMDVIYREIGRSKEAGVFARGTHFVSQLRGDLGTVLAAVRGSFDAACADVPHVAAHLTLSANSPTPHQEVTR